MKFTQTFAPIATLALAVSGSSNFNEGHSRPANNGNTKPVSIPEADLQKLINAYANGDLTGTLSSAYDFIKRNPSIIRSIMKVANQPTHKKARDEIINEVYKPLPKNNGNTNVPSIETHAVNFVYNRSYVLKLIQQAGKQVIVDHPTLVDDFQTKVYKLVKNNPAMFKRLRKYHIEFSEKQNDTYEKAFEMLLKTALIDPKLSAKLAKGAMKIDQMICERSGPTGCSCESDYTSEMETPKAKEHSPNGKGSSTPDSKVEVPKLPETYEDDSTRYKNNPLFPGIDEPEKDTGDVEYMRPNHRDELPQQGSSTPNVDPEVNNPSNIEYMRLNHRNESPQQGSSTPHVDPEVNAPGAADTYASKVEAPLQYGRPSQGEL